MILAAAATNAKSSMKAFFLVGFCVRVVLVLRVFFFCVLTRSPSSCLFECLNNIETPKYRFVWWTNRTEYGICIWMWAWDNTFSDIFVPCGSVAQLSEWMRRTKIKFLPSSFGLLSQFNRLFSSLCPSWNFSAEIHTHTRSEQKSNDNNNNNSNNNDNKEKKNVHNHKSNLK